MFVRKITLVLTLYFSVSAHSASFGNQSTESINSQGGFGNSVATWHKIYGQGGFSTIEDLVVSRQGGYITAGGIGRNAALQWVGAADRQIQVAKVDQGGANLWVKSYTPFGVGLPGLVKRVLEDKSNNIIVAGNVGQYGTKQRKESRDIFVMKLDPNGNKIWARKYGGAEPNTLGDMTVAEDGGILLLGTKGDRKDTKAWLFKVTSDGEFLGESIFPQRVDSSLRVEHNRMLLGGDGLLIVDQQGNAIEYKQGYPGNLSRLYPTENGYLVTGSAKGSKKNHYPHWMGELNEDGEVLWQKTYNFSGQKISYFTALVPSEKGIYAVGAQNKDIGYDLQPFVMMTDLKGEPQWKKLLQKSKKGTTRLAKLVPTADGGFLAGGVTSEDFTYDTSPVRVYGKALLVKFDPEGNSELLTAEKAKRGKLW